jgi:hypothetical protein
MHGARIAIGAGLASLGALMAAGDGASAKQATSDRFRGVSRLAMIEAVKTSPLKPIDYFEIYCDGDTTIGEWLQQLTSTEAKRVDWTAGRCELVNKLNPIDSGGSYCVQATIRLKHPTSKDDTPQLEFYLEAPKGGKPGEVYAFRDVFVTEGDLDYERERHAFQQQWRERFPNAPAPPCTDE